MYLEIFLTDFAVFCVVLGISQDFAEIPEFRRSATARNIRSPDKGFVTGKKCDSQYPQFVRLFHTSTARRSVEFGMRKEIRDLPLFHTYEKCRTKDKKGN